MRLLRTWAFAVALGGVAAFLACSSDDATSPSAPSHAEDSGGSPPGPDAGAADAFRAPSCADGVKNGDETDVDCGGSCAARCAVGQGCGKPSECASGRCVQSACSSPGAADVATGYYHTCARSTDGRVACFGNDSEGQLGLGAVTGQTPTATKTLDLGVGRTAAEVVAGSDYTCARLDDGSVTCWGNAATGQVGTIYDAGAPGSALRVALPAGRKAAHVSGGQHHICIVLDDGALRCAGANATGQLGVGSRDTGSALMVPAAAIALGAGRTAKSVSAGGGHTCAVLDDGSLKCWGDNSAGQLGNGSLPGNNNASGPDRPVDLGVGRTAKAVAAGWNVTCVLRDNDTVACWGNNVTGAIGNGGSDGLVLAPSDVNLGAGRTAAAVVTGLGHACARLDDRSLKCWGANHHGQVGLGAGAGSQVLAPGAAVDFGAGRTVAAAALGGWHSCAVLDDATLRCWGDNSQGQLGLAVDAGAGLPSPSAPVTLPF